MKKILLLAALMMTAVLYATVEETTVFSVVGNEGKTFTTDEISNGTPAVTFTYAQSVMAAAAPAKPSFDAAKSLYIYVPGKYSTSNPIPSGRNMLMGDITGYATPFNPVLHNIDADSVVWTFNYKSTDSSGANGLGRGKRSTAVVLAMDNNNLLQGNGYALINRRCTSSAAIFDLVRVDGGLDTLLNITPLVSCTATVKYPWMVFKIIYRPASNKWELHYLEGSGDSDETKWPDPLTAAYTKAGEAVDATYTNTAMNSFGFYNGYYGKSTYYNFYVRNYMVRTFKSDEVPPTPVDPIVGEVMYENSFVTASKTNMDNVAQGTPAVWWNYSQKVMNGSVAPAVPSTQNYLSVPGKQASGVCGYNMVTAPIAGFKAPFKAKLNEIEADSVVWTFGWHNNNQYILQGFDSARMGNAIVLVADNEDLLAANGYAVVMGDYAGTNGGTKTIRLSYFSEGLNANAHLKKILATPQITLKKYWHVRVAYIPSSDTWRLSYYQDTTNFADPDTCAWIACGEAVNSNHTSLSMTHFGFLNKYAGNNPCNMSIKNYKVTAYGYTPAPAVPATYVKMYTCNFGADSKTELDNYKAGTPKVLWTNTKYNYGTADDCATPSMQNGLIVPGLKAADSKGRNILAAPMAGLGYPWTAKMNESEADSLVWMFNMYYNYDYTGGFDDSQRGIATVLAMDGSDMMTANGYAIVNNQSCYYKLVRFDGGLSANANVVELASTPKLTKNDGTDSSNKRYMTFRVVYVPATNMWKMYYFANTENAFVAPANVETWTLAGSVMDVAHTGKSMTHFGFMNNYVQVATFDAAMTIKNFSLNACFESVDAIALDENRYNGHILDVVDGETVDVALTRNLHAGSYNTLCLPFAMTAYQIETAFGANAKLAKFSDASMDNESLTLDFDDTVTEIEAGVPYIIQPAADITAPVVLSDMAISKTASKIDFSLAKMTGVFSPTALAEGVNTLYLGENNTLYTIEAGSDPLPGMRAYFTLSDAAALAPVRTLRIGKQTPTALDEVSGEVRCTKVLRDGQIIILKGDKLYNIIGQAIH